MHTENKSFKHKGQTYTGTIVWPDHLSEALTLLGERDVWNAFKLGYLEVCRRQICGLTRRRRSQKIDLSDLPESDQELVATLIADLKRQYQSLQQAEESAPPEAPHTAPSDSGETPAEAPAPASVSADSFEADFARYLASLDFSPQQHKETL